VLKGPVGETNTLVLHGRGVFACISPWNFPLAIFTGQIAAALAAGNAVLAKPAEQTPLIAAEAVKLYTRLVWTATCWPWSRVAARRSARCWSRTTGIDGVAFTGGTDTAWRINQTLAARQGPIIPFIAETGGLNGMFVDTTALREQVIDDVILSAFGSAGQRCSALRLLFLPTDTADGVIEGLKGAMDALKVGDPALAHRRRPGDRRRGQGCAGQAPGTPEARSQGLPAPGFPRPRAPLRPVLAEIPDRRLPGARGVRPCPARRAATRRKTWNRWPAPWRQRRLWPDPGRPLASRAFARGPAAGPGRQLSTSTARSPAPSSACSRSAAKACRAPAPRPAAPTALLRYAVERAVSVNITAQGGDPALLNL
jgi:RHH-type proline utilization regulon transcriptional repressor/proline dehydrogenase/delta 1-pyrroline-5-carboxylate dehydrogenase